MKAATLTLYVLALFLASSVTSQSQSSENITNLVNALPKLEDQLSFSALISDPKKYQNTPVIIFGSLSVQNYYNYNYDNAARTHFSLSFLALSSDLKPLGDLTIYAPRQSFQPLVDKLLEANSNGARKIARVKILATSKSFSSGTFSECVEMVDWQFVSSDYKSWQPWALSRERSLTAEEKQAYITANVAAQAKAKKAAEERAAKQKIEGAAATLRFHEQLAAKEDPYGLFQMGQRYLTGNGVEIDLAKAKEYLSKAASKGNPEAQALLQKMGNAAP